jgi:hypothetical protein
VSTLQFRREPADNDYRDIVLVRNFYEALISGYLYHYQGNECWRNQFGRPMPKHKWVNCNFRIFVGGNQSYIKYALDPPANPGDTLCHYLANNTEAVGRRAYMSWVRVRRRTGELSSQPVRPL